VPQEFRRRTGDMVCVGFSVAGVHVLVCVCICRKYKFHNDDGVYFVSFAVVYWIDLFTRECYCNCLVENLNFYSAKGMELFAWCIMPGHVHMVFRDKNKNPEKILGNFKSFTSKAIQYLIENNQQ